MSDLRALAERSKSTAAITPDAWYRSGEIARLLTVHTGYAEMADDDAAFIAAASPNAVLALLDRIAAVQKALRRFVEMYEHDREGSLDNCYHPSDVKEARVGMNDVYADALSLLAE